MRGTRAGGVRAAAALLSVASLAACSSSGDGQAPPAATGTTTSSADGTARQDDDLVLLLDFDSDVVTDDFDTTAVPDVSGNDLRGLVEADAGGAVSLVDDGEGGRAARFPACLPDCGRAIISVLSDESLNPGSGDFAWGARIRLAPEEATRGSNILQKGFLGEGEGGQFKLQVDRLDGRPSCVVQGRSGDPGRVLAAVTVADDRWHSVECRRSGAALEIHVDGERQGRREIPTGIDVSTDRPVRIGGKHVDPDNDQFLGALDDVFISVPP